jgi:di/tricarboxylate transporter
MSGCALVLVVTSSPLVLSTSSPTDRNTADRQQRFVRRRRHEALPLLPQLSLLLLLPLLLLRDADAVDPS